MLELKKKLEEMASTFEAFKKKNDQELAELKSKGSVDVVLKDTVEKHNEAIAKMEKEFEDKLAEVKTAMNRIPQNGPESKDKETQSAAKAAMSRFMRKGSISADEQKAIESCYPDAYKALSVGSDSEGGYFVRPEVSNMITKKVFESSPMRELADSISISSDAFEEMYDWDAPSGGGWIGESGTRPTTTEGGIRMISIPTHEMYEQPIARQKVLDDAAIDIEAWHAVKVADLFARREATAFVAGSGVHKPKGITQYTSGTGFDNIEQVASGSSGAFLADGLIGLQNSLFEAFQGNASWLMQRASAGAIRKLKDGTGRYIWQMNVDRGISEGVPGFLLDKPVRYAADMPAIGADALAAAYGDFKQGYLIVDRIGIRVLRDPFTTKGSVLFYTTKRVGGGVRNFQAIKLQKLEA